MRKSSNLYTHGAYAVTQAMREGKGLDRRTKLWRYLKEVRQNLIQENGGELSEVQNILLEEIIIGLAFTKSIYRYLEERNFEIVDDGGKLLPCIGWHFIAYQNSLTRNLMKFYQLGQMNQESPSERALKAIMKSSSEGET